MLTRTQVLKTKPSILALLQQPEDDDQGEHFTDVKEKDESSDEAESLKKKEVAQSDAKEEGEEDKSEEHADEKRTVRFSIPCIADTCVIGRPCG